MGEEQRKRAGIRLWRILTVFSVLLLIGALLVAIAIIASAALGTPPAE